MFPAFSGILPNFPAASLECPLSLQGYLHLFDCWLSFLLCCLLWSHSHLYLLFMHNHHVQMTRRFESPAQISPLSSIAMYLPTFVLSPCGYVRNMSQSDLIASSPDLIFFQCSIFQCVDSPFVRVSKLEAYESSLILYPSCPLTLLIFFQVLLVFTFAYLPASFIFTSAVFSFGCLTSILSFFRFVCRQNDFWNHKADLVTPWLKPLSTMLLLLG